MRAFGWGLVVVILICASPITAAACEPSTQDIVQAGAQPDAEAVLEYRAVASNPLPWGRTAYAITRVWGSGLVERWKLSGRNSDSCPDVLPKPTGAVMYTIRGTGAPEIYADEPISGIKAAALEARYSSPRPFELSAIDRVLAWVLIAPSWFVGGLAMLGLIVWWRMRRNRDDPDRYLF